jgi:hypothetical protein
MIKFLNLIKINFFFIFCSVIYLIFVLTWYYKPPWVIDHLIYVHISNPNEIADLSFWNIHNKDLSPGHHNERWGVLVPLIVFKFIFWFLSPAQSSQVLIVFVYFLIFFISHLILLKVHGSRVANIFSILFTFAVHHTKNRATEILADPFAILYVLILVYLYVTSSSNFKLKYFLIGFFLFLPALCKIHYGIYSLVILFLIRKNIKNYVLNFFYGLLSSFFFLILIFFLFLEFNIFIKLIINSCYAIISYIGFGLNVSRGPGEIGWSFEWIKLLVSQTTLMPIYFVSALLFFYRERINKYIFSYLFVIFLILIFILASFSNFPANDSYAYPLYIFSIATLAVLIEKFKPSKINEIYFYFLIFIAVLIPLGVIFILKSVKITYFFNSYYSLTIIITITIVPYLFFKKNIRDRNSIFFIFIIILSSNIFWNNWKLLEQHSWWREGYDYHYDYFQSANRLIKKNGTYSVMLSKWPLINGKYSREKMYIEPAIRSQNNYKINIIPHIQEDEISFQKSDYIISDKFLNLDKFSMIESDIFYSKFFKKNETLILYKKLN